MRHKDIRFTIGLQPITKKNSPIIIHVGSARCPKCGSTGKHKLLSSAAYRKYERQALHFIPFDVKGVDWPVNVKATYYMPTKRRVDITNLHEALHDVLVKSGLLIDDNCGIIVSTDGSRVLHDRMNPRTEVEITDALDCDWQIGLELGGGGA